MWFKSTDFGDEKDRVIVRDNGLKTYFASDIAYVMNKLERGFEHLMYIWGADHHGYITRLRAVLIALGGPPERFEVLLVQIVTLFRGGEKARMSKRSGDYVTLRDLRREVGNDAARLFYVMRSNDQHLDFDLELAKQRSNDNPVYYIQYAHARVASVMRQLQERGLTHDAAASIHDEHFRRHQGLDIVEQQRSRLALRDQSCGRRIQRAQRTLDFGHQRGDACFNRSIGRPGQRRAGSLGAQAPQLDPGQHQLVNGTRRGRDQCGIHRGERSFSLVDAPDQ